MSWVSRRKPQFTRKFSLRNDDGSGRLLQQIFVVFRRARGVLYGVDLQQHLWVSREQWIASVQILVRKYFFHGDHGAEQRVVLNRKRSPSAGIGETTPPVWTWIAITIWVLGKAPSQQALTMLILQGKGGFQIHQVKQDSSKIKFLGEKSPRAQDAPRAEG